MAKHLFLCWKLTANWRFQATVMIGAEISPCLSDMADLYSMFKLFTLLFLGRRTEKSYEWGKSTQRPSVSGTAPCKSPLY